MTMLAAIQWVQDQLLTVTGIKSAPDYPGDGEFPIVITHLSTGDITPGNPANTYKSLENIVVELHVSDAGGMAPAFEIIELLHPLIVAKLVSDPTLGGSVQTFGNITYSTSAQAWGGKSTWMRAYVLNNCKLIV